MGSEPESNTKTTETSSNMTMTTAEEKAILAQFETWIGLHDEDFALTLNRLLLARYIQEGRAITPELYSTQVQLWSTVQAKVDTLESEVHRCRVNATSDRNQHESKLRAATEEKELLEQKLKDETEERRKERDTLNAQIEKLVSDKATLVKTGLANLAERDGRISELEGKLGDSHQKSDSVGGLREKIASLEKKVESITVELASARNALEVESENSSCLQERLTKKTAIVKVLQDEIELLERHHARPTKKRTLPGVAAPPPP